MPNLTPQDINAITDFESLLRFLHDKLDWPVDPSKTIEDVTFDYTADELRVHESAAARLHGGIVRQLRDFRADQKIGIFFVEFDNVNVYATSLRQILRGLIPSRRQSGQRRTWAHENLLFICATSNYEQFTFAHFSGEKQTNAKLSTFSWRRDDLRMRTLIDHNLPAIHWPADDGEDAEAWLKAWSKAFDKEPLTRDFFRRFDRALAAIKEDLQKNNKFSSADAYTKSQLLLERLLFLYFLQNRGWLSRQRDYLISNFNAHRQAPKEFTYYEVFLEKLFWTLASSPGSQDRLPGIPFLNGGLFDDDEFALTAARRERNPPLKIRNLTFEFVFDELLEAFNFTVREDTPLSQEVAVDPEMLGKVFESIVLQAEAADPDAVAPDKRKATGSYYTPRIVVHFICKEVLRQYLISRLPDEPFTKNLRDLIEIDASDGLHAEETDRLKQLLSPSDAMKILPHLLKPRCCDPAVGSGAFPVGLLHELVNLRRLVEAAAGGYVDPVRKEGTKWLHRVKEEIIQDCLYGVDIQQQAIEICQLRLWLSLVVDYDLGIDPFTADPTQFRRAIDSVEPLPNLEMNFRRGDSLHDYISGIPIIIHPQSASVYREDFNFIRDKGSKLHHAKHGIDKRKLRIEILRRRLEVARKVLEAEQSNWRKERSILTDMLFANETATKAQKRKRVEAELARVDTALTQVEADRKKLDELAAKSFTDPTFQRELRRLEGADFDSPFNFAWHIDFAEIFAPKAAAAVSTVKGEFAFVNQMKGQGTFVEERTEPSGFDIIVGNPPFVTVRNRDKRELYAERWPRVCYKNYQLVCPFFEMSYGLLQPDGQLGFIVSNAFAKREFGKPLVQDFFPTVNLQEIIDCSGLLFPGHGTPTCIAIGRRRPSEIKSTVRVAAILPGGGDLRTPPEGSSLWRSLAEHYDEPGFQNSQISVADHSQSEMARWPWSFFSGADEKKIEASSAQLGQWCSEPIGAQFITGKDEAFVLPISYLRRIDVPPEYLRIYATGEDIRNWVVQPNDLIIFPYDQKLQPLKEPLPAPIAKHLLPYKEPLENSIISGSTKKKETKLKWFEFRRLARAKFAEEFNVVVPHIATHAHFVLASHSIAFKEKALAIVLRRGISKSEMLAVTGLLNSSYVLYKLKQVCFNKGAGEDEHRDRFEYAGGKLEEVILANDIIQRLQGSKNAMSEKLTTLCDACGKRGQKLASFAMKKLLERTGEAYTAWNLAFQGKPNRELQPPFTSNEELRDRFACAIARRDQLRSEMIARQEEMDWLVYAAYGLLSAGDPSARVEEEPAPLDQAQRPFRLWDAAAGNFASAVELVPADWSTKRRELWQARLAAIRDNEHIRRIEQPVYKRRWDEQWKVGNRWQSGQPAYDAEFIEAFDWWLSEKAEWWLEKKKAGGPVALDDWTAALLKDSRVAAAWPVVSEAVHRLELWKLQQKAAGKAVKLAPVLDASGTAFASYFKSLVKEQCVPEDIPFAVSYDKIKPPVPKHVQRIRGKLNVPRERFHVTADGNYRVAKPF
jgi:hypothetical protein